MVRSCPPEVREEEEDELKNVHMDPKKELLLITDASLDGISGLLVQDGSLIYAVSKTLTETERRYSTIERELLGAVWSMKRLRSFL